MDFFVLCLLTIFLTCDIIHLTFKLSVKRMWMPFGIDKKLKIPYCAQIYVFYEVIFMIQRTLFALCDPTRREILKLLKKGDRTAGEISERFDISPPAISRHLCILQDAELISGRREGKYIFYSLQSEPIEFIREWLFGLVREDE